MMLTRPPDAETVAKLIKAAGPEVGRLAGGVAAVVSSTVITWETYRPPMGTLYVVPSCLRAGLDGRTSRAVFATLDEALASVGGRKGA